MAKSSSIDNIKLEVMEVQSSDIEIKLGGVMTATTDFSPIDIKIGGTPTTNNKKPKIESLWCNLPGNVLISIIERLCYVDQIYFRAVCKDWRSKIYGSVRRSDNFPWILAASTGDILSRNIVSISNQCYLFDPIHKQKYTIENQILDGAQIHASKFGWLLLSRNTKSTYFFSFYSPFTNKIIELPELHMELSAGKILCYGNILYCSNFVGLLVSRIAHVVGVFCFIFEGVDDWMGAFKPGLQEWKAYPYPRFSFLQCIDCLIDSEDNENLLILMKITRGTSSVTDYLRSIKSVADDLALAGAPLENLNLVMHVLNGIGTEFNPIAEAVRARDTVISFEELFDKLTEYETYLKREETQGAPVPITANNTRYNQNNNQNGKKNYNQNRGGTNINKNNRSFNTSNINTGGKNPDMLVALLRRDLLCRNRWLIFNVRTGFLPRDLLCFVATGGASSRFAPGSCAGTYSIDKVIFCCFKGGLEVELEPSSVGKCSFVSKRRCCSHE
ncbi:hypothetical protein EZV62_006727 [Acer yangbiense]|uniref:F-box domain-containing protein n=1 Tax=Acer yangbiense TaxID=1000413 RepID=A0A5C7I9T5_9ROSI|nr:hypothetical protein EZV62_006727 [Acer yangbiense]